jgi:hypothetical protein
MWKTMATVWSHHVYGFFCFVNSLYVFLFSAMRATRLIRTHLITTVFGDSTQPRTHYGKVLTREFQVILKFPMGTTCSLMQITDGTLL